jgi:hypothetical protein
VRGTKFKPWTARGKEGKKEKRREGRTGEEKKGKGKGKGKERKYQIQ